MVKIKETYLPASIGGPVVGKGSSNLDFTGGADRMQTSSTKQESPKAQNNDLDFTWCRSLKI